MKITETPIQLHLSDDEASLLLTALGKFLAGGGIWSHLPDDYELAPEDVRRNEVAIQNAEAMYNDLQGVLRERHEDQEMEKFIRAQNAEVSHGDGSATPPTRKS